MQRRVRAWTVVVAAALAAWGGWWWVKHTYVNPAARPAAAVVATVVASPDICVEPNGVVVNNCAEELAEGEFVLVAPGHIITLPGQPVTVQPDTEEVEGAPVAAGDFSAAGPCVTPPGAIFSTNCAAPPNSAAVGGGPSGGGGGGGGDAAANPCPTPAGAIFAPGCAAPPAP